MRQIDKTRMWRKAFEREAERSVYFMRELSKIRKFLEQEYPEVLDHWDGYVDTKLEEWAKDLLARVGGEHK